jgi:hypothetical protein
MAYKECLRFASTPTFFLTALSQPTFVATRASARHSCPDKSRVSRCIEGSATSKVGTSSPVSVLQQALSFVGTFEEGLTGHRCAASSPHSECSANSSSGPTTSITHVVHKIDQRHFCCMVDRVEPAHTLSSKWREVHGVRFEGVHRCSPTEKLRSVRR